MACYMFCAENDELEDKDVRLALVQQIRFHRNSVCWLQKMLVGWPTSQAKLVKSGGGIASRPELDETDFLFSDMGLKLFECWKRLSASVASEVLGFTLALVY